MFCDTSIILDTYRCKDKDFETLIHESLIHKIHKRSLNQSHLFFLVPSAPEKVQAIRTGAASVRVLWKRATSDSSVGPIQGYKVYYRPAASMVWKFKIACSSCNSLDLENLAVLKPYRFHVMAFSEAGDGVPSPTFTVLQGIP